MSMADSQKYWQKQQAKMGLESAKSLPADLKGWYLSRACIDIANYKLILSVGLRMYTSRLTTPNPHEPLNSTLPTLSPRLYSFAEPNSRNSSLIPSESSAPVSDFVRDFQLIQLAFDIPVATIGQVAMVNGNDKWQVKQALEEQNIERNIKNRMNKYLSVLDKVSTWGTVFEETHSKDLQSSIIMQISPQVPVPTHKHSEEPIAQSRLSPTSFGLSVSRRSNIIKANEDTHNKVQNSRDSEPKNKSATSSKTSHSKVFKKIQLKSVNFVDQQKDTDNSNSIRKDRAVKSPKAVNKKESLSSKKRPNLYIKTKETNIKKPAVQDKKRHTISRREPTAKPNSGHQRKNTTPLQQDRKSIDRSHSKSVSSSRINFTPRNNPSNSRVNPINSRVQTKHSPKKPVEQRKRESKTTSRSGSKSNLSKSRLKEQVARLQRNQIKDQAISMAFQNHKSNNHLLRQTMEKTSLFLDMLKMMED